MKLILIFGLWFFFLFSSCTKEDQKSEEKSDQSFQVVSVNYPLHYFAQRIGGDFIQTVYPIPADGDPAYWNPDEKGIGLYQKTDLILDNGADYAKWMAKVSLPTSRIINTSNVFKDEYILLTEGTTHSHGPEGEHVHKGYAFTTWLDFSKAMKQAQAIRDALVAKLPDLKTNFDLNYQKLADDLQYLDDEMKKISVSIQNTTLFASHPVYQYLGTGYNLNILSEHWEPDQEPDKEQWDIFKSRLDKNPGNIMLWEDQPLESVARKLSSFGIRAVVFNPCANKPDSGDFLSVMNQNLSNLKAALKD